MLPGERGWQRFAAFCGQGSNAGALAVLGDGLMPCCAAGPYLYMVQLATQATEVIRWPQPVFVNNVLGLLAAVISRYEFKMKNPMDENSSFLACFRYKINNAA